jgi:hypothetical protein
VQGKTFDLFFNSPWGYRGQYCMGVENGLHRNRQLLDVLKERLLAYAQARTITDFGIDRIRRALELPTAKVWLFEPGQIDVSDLSLKEEILYSVWIQHAREARAALDANRPPSMAQLNAITGVRAPCGRVLDVKGAWTNDSGRELLDPSKARRSENIRDFGFS